MQFDPRLTPYRDDLAADFLRNKVKSDRYTVGKPSQIIRGSLDLRRLPSAKAALDTQLLHGETVTVYDEADGWAWIQNQADDYVGYVDAAGLSPQVMEITHRVKVLRTFVFPESDLKAPPLDFLSMAAGVAVGGNEGAFCALAGGGFVYRAHLEPRDSITADYVATAQQFLGTPYLWGGKDSIGIDCSGLVQVALAQAGISCPRDSNQQAEQIGSAIAWLPGRGSDLRRGDLVYFPGHVAISLGGSQVLHANAHHMMVAVEDLAALEARVRAESGGTGITAIRRIG